DTRLLECALVRLGDTRAALAKRFSLRVRRQPTDLFDQRRQRRFRVGRDRHVDLGVALEILIVTALKKMLRGNADDLRVALARLPRNIRDVAAFESEDDVRLPERTAVERM